jgi:hypothetical protein
VIADAVIADAVIKERVRLPCQTSVFEYPLLVANGVGGL